MKSVSMQHNFEQMTIHELCELLVFKTTELLNAFQERHADGAQIQSLQVEVQEIREAIRTRRSDSASGLKNQTPNF